MFILSLTYIAPLEEVDALRGAHLAWLKQGHESGHFIGWGRKTPVTGGIILARGKDREEIQALAHQDPFVTSKVATVEVIEWNATYLAEGLEAYLT